MPVTKLELCVMSMLEVLTSPDISSLTCGTFLCDKSKENCSRPSVSNASDVVFHFVHVHIGGEWGGRWDCQCSRSAGSGVMVEGKRLNVLAILSMEKNFLNCQPEIKEKIIELFAAN
uniref:Uncharacterized protein n=1 Tax=Timema douglasi TaxID=61478 RepID=A0A7R8VFR6_TIMDO|nr:unnamed protein product [Timema douglasi]